MKQNKPTSSINSKKLVMILSFLGIYLLSTGSSWLIFSYLKDDPGIGDKVITGDLESARSKLEQLPKTEECPLNGGMFTEVEKGIWNGRRPITAMVENSADARPHSGISKADIVYEAVAEGGITRFMAVMYCGAAAEDVKIAPVRSARVYFINWAQEYGNNPIFVHVGGANNYSGSGDTAREVRALEMLESLGWRVPKGNDFDTIYDSGFPVFWRNPERLGKQVATEHTMMVSTDAAYKEAEKRGFAAQGEDGKEWDSNYIAWKFADDKALSSPTADSIAFKFWDNKPDYDVEWKYDRASNRYMRFTGGKAHTDLEYDNEQLAAKNIVVMSVKEKGPVDRNMHMVYTTVGEGKALIFQNGDVIEGTWKKASNGARTKFFAKNGSEISFVRGTIWIEAVPAGNTIEY